MTAARTFVRGLNVLLKSIRLYGPEHERVSAQSATAWDQCRATLAKVGNAAFVLGVSGSQLLLDGTPLGDTPIERGFAKTLASSGLNSIQFTGRATQEEFNRFAGAFAGAGPQAKDLAEQLKAALGQGNQAGIRVNEVRFVPEDSALADARTSAQIAVSAMGVDTEQAQKIQSLLDDPGKLLRFIAATEATDAGAPMPPTGLATEDTGGNHTVDSSAAGTGPAAPAPVPPLQDAELTSVLRLLAQFGRAGNQPGSAGTTDQMQQQFSNLPGTAQATLQQALANLSTAAPTARPDTPMLLRLAEHLAIRHALDHYESGDVEVNAVREMLDRMSSEIVSLRRLLRSQEGVAEGAAEVDKIDAEDLENQFWAEMPGESLRSLLQSTRAWCVPPQQVRRLVEDLLGQGDSDVSTSILVNYAASVESPNPEARHRAVRGLSDLADLYVGGYSEILGAAVHHLCEQLNREASPELHKSLTETFQDLNEAAAATTSSALFNLNLTCLACREQRLTVPGREELVEALSTRDVQLYCPQCEAATPWSAAKPSATGGAEQTEEAEARPAEGGPERRRAPRARMEVPVRVRCDAPELTFTEINTTVNISRTGILFRCSHPLRRGMEVFVQAPYNQGDELPETRAKVVRVHALEDQYEVAVHLLR